MIFVRKFKIIIFVIALTFIGSNCFSADQIFKLTDTKGEIYNIHNLKAENRATGLWTIPPPDKKFKFFSFIYKSKEGRITTEERYTVNFSDIKNIKFNWRKEDAQDQKYFWKENFTITKKDGSTISYDEKNGLNYKEINQKGEVVRELNNVLHWTAPGPEGCHYYLVGFSGSAIAKSGKTGEFYISYQEVQEINFP